MDSITKKIEIDFYSPTSYEVVIAQQGDNISRTIEFTLYNQGEPYNITEEEASNILAIIEGRRGDHSSFMKECELKDNVITAVLDSNILYEAGTIQAKLFLYDSNANTILSTIPFLISVQKDPCAKNRIEAEKSSAFDWLILQFHKLKNSFLSHTTDFSNPHKVTKEQVGLGNVPNVTTNNQTPEYEASENLSELSSGETLSSAFGKLSKAVSSLISHLSNTVSHITASERADWNAAKQKLDGIESGAEVNVQPDWNITDTESDAFIKNKPAVYTTAEIDNKFSSLETNIDWKESVSTYNEIASAYPHPQDGWTVNVQDTDYTYRYNGTAWIAISANAIPKATSSVDGLFSKEDYVKFESLYNGAVAGVKGNAESTYRTGNVNLTAENIGALPISGGTLSGDLRIKGSSNYGTKINLGDGDYVHLSEPEDDCLEVKAKKINFVVSDTTDTKFTLNGEKIGKSADQLKTPRTIDGVRFDGCADITHFGVCETSASTAAKTVSIPGFELKEGTRILVLFKNKNSAANITLNVNSTGAKRIIRRTQSNTVYTENVDCGVYEFIYDGTNWNVMSNHISEDTVSFISNDTTDSNAASWTSVTTLTSGLKIKTALERISTMFKNVRYLYRLLGKTNISAIGDGSVTGAINKIHTDLSNLSAKSYSGWFVQKIGNMVEINAVTPLTISGTLSESTGTYFYQAFLTIPAQIRPTDSTYMNVQSTVQSSGVFNSTFAGYNNGSGILTFNIATWKPFQNTSIKLHVRIRFNE